MKVPVLSMLSAFADFLSQSYEFSSFPWLRSHDLTIPFESQEAILSPFGLNLHPLTLPECP